jgi:hypothetical protein
MKIMKMVTKMKKQNSEEDEKKKVNMVIYY